MEGVDDLHVCLVIFYFRLASSENDDRGNCSDLLFLFFFIISLSLSLSLSLVTTRLLKRLFPLWPSQLVKRIISIDTFS